MKKNITINLCGRLFNIDEDAYELLRHYIDTLRSYFAKQEGGEEIADDIESRIAELLEELKNEGIEAVNIDHIKEIIHRIGKPEEMDGYEHDSTLNEEASAQPVPDAKETDDEKASFHSNESENGHKYSSFRSFLDDLKEFFRERRFYRNPKDKMVAGVISGLASTFEIDVTLLRLLVIVGVIILSMLGSMFGYYNWHVFFNANVFLTVVVFYIIMAIIMPEAETPEQQLKMQGKPVNMQNLAEEVVQNVSETDEKSTEQSGCLKSVFNGILKFLGSCLKVLMVLLAIFLFFFGIAVLISAVYCLSHPETTFIDWPIEDVLSNNLPLFITFIIGLLATLFIPAYAIVQHLIRPLKVYQRLILLFVWIAALATTFATDRIGGNILNKYRNEKHQQYKNERSQIYQRKQRIDLEQYRQKNTHDGIFIQPHEWDFLQERGWRILNAEGCNDRFTAYGEYYLANRHNSRYLDCYDDRHRQRYRAERTDTLMPGRYKLTCAARANGRGAFVYTLINGKKQLIEIPATGNVGGTIWQEAKDEVERLDSLNAQSAEDKQRVLLTAGKKRRRLISRRIASSDTQSSEFMREIARANNDKGYGWNRLEFNPIIITKPTAVSYGLTSDPDFTGQTWLGQWFSACDFVFEKLDE